MPEPPRSDVTSQPNEGRTRIRQSETNTRAPTGLGDTSPLCAGPRITFATHFEWVTDNRWPEPEPSPWTPSIDYSGFTSQRGHYCTIL